MKTIQLVMFLTLSFLFISCAPKENGSKEYNLKTSAKDKTVEGKD